MKNKMKYIKAMIGLVVSILITSCTTEKEKSCISIKKPIEIAFEDSMLQDICLSPFEEGKIWARTNNKNHDIFEIDNSTGQKVVLDKKKFQIFFSHNDNGRIQYCHKDQYDSIAWIVSPNKNLIYYDQRSKIIQELPVSYVTRIISKPNEVFFVSLQGFCYWDRKSKSIMQVNGIPKALIQTSVMPDDTTIVLDAKYTYFFKSGKVKKGIFLYDNEHIGEWYSFKASSGCGLFSKNDSLFYIYEGVAKNLQLPYKGVDNTKIIEQKYWQSDNNFFYSFDPKSNETQKYGFRLPNVNNYATNYKIDYGYIWIMRPGQMMLISLSDNKLFEYSIKSEEGYIKTIFDECNVYSLYNNKVILTSKEDFIKKCVLFDAKQFDLEIKIFDSIVDSVGILTDTIPSVSLAKLNYLKDRYSNVQNIEVRKKLDEMNVRAFYSNYYKFPDGYISCYKDKSMPMAQRKSCIKSLVDKYGRSSDFNKVVHLKSEFVKYFDKPDRENDYYFISEVDSVEAYLSKIDSFQSANLAEDTLYYFKSLALETICRTHWYCHEGCGGCDFSLVTDKLKSFQTKYPESKLFDNSVLYFININYMYDYGEEESVIAQNKEYEEFLKKYPDSDLKADVQFSVFMNWASMQNLKKRETKVTAQRFINEFKADKRITDVRQRLKELEIK
jgi:hypothetical protein